MRYEGAVLSQERNPPFAWSRREAGGRGSQRDLPAWDDCLSLYQPDQGSYRIVHKSRQIP
jgi:hypothetical protein